MINVSNMLLNSWYSLLNGNLNVPVYILDAPEDATDYVLLRIESESDSSNNAAHVTKPVVITEVVTRFNSAELINHTAAHDIDSQIAGLLFTNSGDHRVPQTAGIQIVTVRRTDSQYIPEDDGRFRYYRIVTRNLHRVVQA